MIALFFKNNMLKKTSVLLFPSYYCFLPFFSQAILWHGALLKPWEENIRPRIGKIIEARKLHLKEKQSEFTGCDWRAPRES